MVLRLWGKTDTGEGIIYGDDVVVASDGAVYIGSRKCNVFACMAFATQEAVDILNKGRWHRPILLCTGVVLSHVSATKSVKLYQNRDTLTCTAKVPYWTGATPGHLVAGTYAKRAKQELCEPTLARQRAEAWLSDTMSGLPRMPELWLIEPPVKRYKMVQAFAMFLQSQKDKLLERIDAEYAAA